MQTLVKSLHAENLVHGDLRYPNIICNGEKVMIVDFDWAGREGESASLVQDVERSGIRLVNQ